MRKKALLPGIVIVILALLLFCGCDAGYKRSSAGASEFYNAMTVIQTCVPHIGGMDLRLDRIELLETDNYGRSLFRYSFALTGSEAFVIIQKTEGSLVYYCEDYCYLYNQHEGTTNERDIDWLKEQNSWDSPTTTRKTIYLDFANASPDHVGIDNPQDVEKKILLSLKERYPDTEWEEADIGLNCLENYPGCGQIIFVETHNDDSVTQYLVLYDNSAEKPVVVLEEIQERNDLRELIISFKDAHCTELIQP